MDVRTYNRCVDEWGTALYRYAHSLLKNRDDAQDVVQDAFHKLWERRHHVEPQKIKSYLFAIAHNRAIDHFRKPAKVQPLGRDELNRTTHQTMPDLQAALHDALATLPEIQKSVVLLRDYEGYSYEEIADITELNLAQVKVYIFRARQKLKNYIGSIDALV